MAQGLEPASEGFSGALRLQCSRAFSAQPQPADAPVDRPTLKPETLNANLRKAQYAVRGELLKRAMDMAAQGREIIETNGECARGVVGGVAVVDMWLWLGAPTCPDETRLARARPQSATRNSWARPPSPSTARCAGGPGGGRAGASTHLPGRDLEGLVRTNCTTLRTA